MVFNDYRYCPYVMSNVSDKNTMIFWKNFSEKVIDDFKDKGYTFNHIAEMLIKTKANKRDMSYVFYNKHNMSATDWKLKALINKNKSLINNFPRNLRHPLNRRFENYRV